jgi:hypothetical protein
MQMKHETVRNGCYLFQVCVAASLIGIVAMSCRTPQDDERLLIAQKGKAIAVIAIPDAASAEEETAARTLAEYLKKANGAELQILHERDLGFRRNAIHVGRTSFALTHAGIPEAEGNWMIRNGNGRLFLAGGGSSGTLYAVFRFLEDEIGVRWWEPGAETVPQLPIIQVGPLDRKGAPTFAMRSTYLVDSPPHDVAVFFARNRLNGPFQNLPKGYGDVISYGLDWKGRNGIDSLEPDCRFFENDKETQRAPLDPKDAKTVGTVLSGLEKALADERKRDADSNSRKPRFHHVSANEFGRGAAEPGTMNPDYLGLVGRCIESARKDDPNARIETWAYGENLLPPKGTDATGLTVLVCDLPAPGYSPLFNRSIDTEERRPFRNALESWIATGAKTHVLEYGSPFMEGRRFPYPPCVETRSKDYRFFRAMGIHGIVSQTDVSVGGAFSTLKLWTTAKLLEEQDRDPKALVEEFMVGYYGKAAPKVKEYLALLEEIASPWPVAAISNPEAFGYLSPVNLVRLSRVLDQAASKASGSPELEARVGDLRISLDFAILSKWDAIEKAHRDAGGSARNLPFDKNEIIDRYARGMSRGLAIWYRGNAFTRKMVHLQKQVIEFRDRKSPEPSNPAPENK